MYQFSCFIQEPHGRDIYCLRVCKLSERAKRHLSSNEVDSLQSLFATVALRRMNVYRLIENRIDVLQVYEDKNPEEEYYALSWRFDTDTRRVYVLVGGSSGIIRQIDLRKMKIVSTLVNHGGAIHDLSPCPTNDDLYLSASADHSIRLWNMKNDTLLAVFGGFDGHRNEILSISWRPDGSQFVSGAMDNRVHIWSALEDPRVKERVEACDQYSREDRLCVGDVEDVDDENTVNLTSKPVMVHRPTAAFAQLHQNYIDCVLWYNQDAILSKSVHGFREPGDGIYMWSYDIAPPLHSAGGDPNLGGEWSEVASKIHSHVTSRIHAHYKYPKCAVWYIKFAVCREKALLASGHVDSGIYLYHLRDENSVGEFQHKQYITHSTLKASVRCCDFAAGGNTLLCSTSNGHVVRFDES